jgi:hypothetical protein
MSLDEVSLHKKCKAGIPVNDARAPLLNDVRRVHFPIRMSIPKIWSVFYCVVLVACVQIFPDPKECDVDAQCILKQGLDTLIVIKSRIDYWDNVMLVAAIVAAVAGLIATIMIALQGDENRYWTRPIGIVATALVTGITTVVTSFHIPENKDKYITAYGQLVRDMNKFDQARRQAQNSENKDKLLYDFISDFTNIKLEILKAQGSLNLVTSPLQPGTQNPEEATEPVSPRAQPKR